MSSTEEVKSLQSTLSLSLIQAAGHAIVITKEIKKTPYVYDTYRSTNL